MSTAARQILTDFDALPEPERDAILMEILRRPVGVEAWPDEGLESAAEDLFLSYDEAEAADAAASR